MFPHVNLSGIVLGVNLGFAPNGRAKTKSGNTAIIVTDCSQEIGSDLLGTLVELRLGGNFPIWDNPNGNLTCTSWLAIHSVVFIAIIVHTSLAAIIMLFQAQTKTQNLLQ